MALHLWPRTTSIGPGTAAECTAPLKRNLLGGVWGCYRTQCTAWIMTDGNDFPSKSSTCRLTFAKLCQIQEAVFGGREHSLIKLQHYSLARSLARSLCLGKKCTCPMRARVRAHMHCKGAHNQLHQKRRGDAATVVWKTLKTTGGGATHSAHSEAETARRQRVAYDGRVHEILHEINHPG